MVDTEVVVAVLLRAMADRAAATEAAVIRARPVAVAIRAAAVVEATPVVVVGATPAADITKKRDLASDVS